MLNRLPPGQQQARNRWGTHESGAAFDKKKTPYLSEQAQEFLAQQSFCVIAGLGTHQKISGLLAMEKPGFVQVLDRQICLLELGQYTDCSPIIQALRQCQSAEKPAHLGLFFINHASRERLCVQGEARLVPADSPLHSYPLPREQKLQLLLHVRQAFFHCGKYIRTRVAGLTAACPDSSNPDSQLHLPPEKNPHCLTEEIIAFIRQQVLCFLCTVDQEGYCAVNHRGGKPGFLVPFLPAETAPGGFILLPDYAGNGAFEAIGNILETQQAALLIPSYTAQEALCLSGSADVISMRSLPTELRQQCAGAERVLALRVHHIELQAGDWSATLAYEQERAQDFITRNHPMLACPR
jgi:uncharacterized protein